MTTVITNPSTALNKNYLKNSRFSVIQSTASGALANSTTLPTASLGYLGETEWCVAANGGTPTYAFSSVNESITFTGAASTTAIYLLQRLESKDVITLANKLATLTFSAEISNSLLTSVTWEVYRPTASDDTHGTIASPSQTLIASGTFAVNSTLTRYSATFALPALAAKGLEVRLRVGAQTSGTWVVARLQLEEGNIATTFNCDSYPIELQKCQRYFRDLGAYALVFSGSVVTSSIYNAKEGFEKMFAIPVPTATPNAAGGFANAVGTLTLDTNFVLEARTATGTGTGAYYTSLLLSAHIP